jgi:O-antigen ligase
MLMYESFVNPIAIEYISTGRGGGSRIRGAYADIMNYAVYIELFFIIISYWFLANLYGRVKLKINAVHVAIALVFVFYGLTRIKHVSTWTVTLVVFVLMMIHNLRNARGFIFVIVLITIISAFFAEDIYNSQIEPLIGKELRVVDGESESSQALNGRMSRWERYFEIWEQMPMSNHFIGITTANFPETDNMIGAGMHSDYVRLLFLTGFIGVGAYVFFILAVSHRCINITLVG